MAKSPDEEHRRCKKRMEAGDADAFDCMGAWYFLGEFGLHQDIDKGLELTIQAAELGSTNAHYNIANFYSDGQYAPKNAKKALFHYQQAAMKGHMKARHNLGYYEVELGSSDRAIKHWMIATASGEKLSLDSIKLMFAQGSATKAQYERALRAYQIHQEDVHSDQRTRVLEHFQGHTTL